MPVRTRKRSPRGVKELTGRSISPNNSLYKFVMEIHSREAEQPNSQQVVPPEGAKIYVIEIRTTQEWPGTTAVLDVGQWDDGDFFYSDVDVFSVFHQSDHYPEGLAFDRFVSASIETTGTQVEDVGITFVTVYFK